MMLIARAAATGSYLVAILYSTVFLKKNRRPTYFKCAFYGLLPLCLSGFYYLALMAAEALPSGFSLGILGEMSAYLFITTANTALIPKEKAEKKRRISASGLIGALVLAAILFAPVLLSFSIPMLVSALLYVAAMCPCLYFCVDVCRNRFRNPFKTGVRPFNLLVMLHLVGTAVWPLAACGLFSAWESVAAGVCAAAWVAPGLAGMALLRKGLAPWEI